ncbi:MAG TPA: hypothetical protein VMB74_00380, partial [Streptosporangiaceae bacterium]|nr:hypothetical protein [Streptosporangiaceae bacterium]
MQIPDVRDRQDEIVEPVPRPLPKGRKDINAFGNEHCQVTVNGIRSCRHSGPALMHHAKNGHAALLGGGW